MATQSRPIPTCAGQPVPCELTRQVPRAYPRVCGATLQQAMNLPGNMGLSPRVRGNPGRQAALCTLRGPIPACAGQPARCLPRSRRPRAYPRVCGATGVVIWLICAHGGLSPRVRGNRRCLGFLPAGVGPIPACAGQPKQLCRRGLDRGAYPRVCGATRVNGDLGRLGGGLSPRVRGNRKPPMLCMR